MSAELSTGSVTARLADEDLVERVRRGEEAAFELLFERHRVRVLSHVQGLVRDRHRAEDVTQEVFVSALRRIRATDAPIAFRPWIHEIAKNACIDAHRRGAGPPPPWRVGGGGGR